MQNTKTQQTIKNPTIFCVFYFLFIYDFLNDFSKKFPNPRIKRKLPYLGTKKELTNGTFTMGIEERDHVALGCREAEQAGPDEAFTLFGSHDTHLRVVFDVVL